jgi:hypothetical protein
MNAIAEKAYESGVLHAQFEAQPYKRVIAGGSVIEAVGGTGALALAILGLAGVFPLQFAAIAVMGIGAALAFEGGAIGAKFSKLLSVTGGGTLGATELGGGMTAEFLGGVAGMILGLLALLGVAAGTLIPVAAIVFGGALLFGTGATLRLNLMQMTAEQRPDHVQEVTREAVSAAAAVQVLTGIGAVTLGILALVGINPLVLSLVALLSVGASVALCGTAICTRTLTLVRG